MSRANEKMNGFKSRLGVGIFIFDIIALQLSAGGFVWN
jgi:hypothetical protein